jgi:DNA-binding response OmpR family regulator
MTDPTQQSDPAPDTTATDRSETPEEEPITLLLVEPNSGCAELFAAFAARADGQFRVNAVGQLADALDAVAAGVKRDDEWVAVDCVVTENRLQQGSGVELVSRLRERGDEVPVVFHTTCPSDDAEAAAFEAGADAYFEKGAERGRYAALLDRARSLVEERGPRNRRPEPEVAARPDALGKTGATLLSEE